MTYKPADYSKGLIYKLVCLDTDITDIYVGSTTSFKLRKREHKNSCNNEKSRGYNSYVYKFIRENGEWRNWDMILVESYPCKSSLDLRKREREIIEELKSTLNKNIPSRTIKEYYEKKKEYYYDNKDKIAEQQKTYRNDNKQTQTITCDCGSTCRIYDEARHLKTIKHQNYINALHSHHA